VLEVEDGWRLWRWRWRFLHGLVLGLLLFDNSVREAGLRFLQYFCEFLVVVSRIP
jgi:hypothetical protein